MASEENDQAARTPQTLRAPQRPSQSSIQPQRPPAEDHDVWHGYWQALNQPWRTEPEIEEERKMELAHHRDTIIPNIQKGIYPFKDIEHKLTRADIEWLLATHENGRGPVNWGDENQREWIGLDLRGADLCGVDLSGLPLARVSGGLSGIMSKTIEQRNAAAIQLVGANLREAHLEGANLRDAHLEGAYLRYANLAGANLCGAYFDRVTDMYGTILGDEKLGFASLADLQWGNVNLSVIDWAGVKELGDERDAYRRINIDEAAPQSFKAARSFRKAVRAYRQVAHALQSQGINEEVAERFLFHAKVLERVALRLEGKLGAYIFSWLLFLLTGYGYKPERVLYWYIGVILAFAASYYFLSQGQLLWYQALLTSIRDFHGRGFFSDPSQTVGLQIYFSAIEAFFGLFIEAGLIAAFTQSFFEKKGY
jgi:hypothetical protein